MPKSAPDNINFTDAFILRFTLDQVYRKRLGKLLSEV